jgi:hypothetical protein
MTTTAIATCALNTLPKSDRRAALQNVACDLAALDDQLEVASTQERAEVIDDVMDASAALSRTADNFTMAASHGLGAGMNLALAAGHGALGVAHAAAGTGLVAAAGVARVEEASDDFLGRATQLLGRAFIGAGNATREAADLGGEHVQTYDIAGDTFAPRWSDALLSASREEFDHAAKHTLYSLGHVAGAVANGVMGIAELGKAAGNTVRAAQATLAAAKDLADVAVIEVAERAVELASVAEKVVDLAVAYGEEGVDAAGEALQAAGRALVVAGNAVNTARGKDTGVR